MANIVKVHRLWSGFRMWSAIGDWRLAWLTSLCAYHTSLHEVLRTQIAFVCLLFICWWTLTNIQTDGNYSTSQIMHNCSIIYSHLAFHLDGCNLYVVSFCLASLSHWDCETVSWCRGSFRSDLEGQLSSLPYIAHIFVNLHQLTTSFRNRLLFSDLGHGSGHWPRLPTFPSKHRSC